MTDNRSNQIVGNYRLVKKMGREGYGRVYLGEHKKLGTYVAIKILPESLTKKDGKFFDSVVTMITTLFYKS